MPVTISIRIPRMPFCLPIESLLLLSVLVLVWVLIRR